MTALLKTWFYKALLLAAFSPGGESFSPSDVMLNDPLFREATRDVCKERKTEYYFYFSDDDLNANRREYNRLRDKEIQLRDCPPLSDLNRIPTQEYCNDLRSFLQEMRSKLYARLGVVRDRDELEDLREKLQKMSDFYYLFQQAHWAEYGRPSDARFILKEIRDIMGPDAYYRSEWPYPFPPGSIY